MKPTLTMVANAGVLLKYEDISLLVDGLHLGDNYFSGLSRHVFQDILSGNPPFENLNYLAFTHEHQDHYVPEIVEQFILRRDVEGLFLPRGSKETDHLHHIAQIKDIPVWMFPGGSPHIWELPGMRLASLPCPHSKPEQFPLPHYCLLIDISNWKILFLGDADWNKDHFACLEDIGINCVITNPLWMHNKEALFILNEVICPQDVVLVHVPPLEKDRFGIRRMAEQCVGVSHNFSVHLLHTPEIQIPLHNNYLSKMLICS
ncbi:MAG TPA: MBL fold metallo-hydrolase [Clostridiaceae bacterium]|nr:MBL fold metallo-hydrolase [Clostridiaceae bacterium]